MIKVYFSLKEFVEKKENISIKKTLTKYAAGITKVF